MAVKRRSQASDADPEPEQVTEQRPRRRTRRVPHAEKQPEGEQPAKADVSERASGAADSSKALGKKLGAGEPPSALTPKVMAPVTLRQQNLRPPMLARPPALPPKPKLRQHHYEFLSDWRRHQMTLAAAAGTRPALTALPMDAVRAPSLPAPPMPRLPASSAPSLSDPGQLIADLEAAIAAVLRDGDSPQPPAAAPGSKDGLGRPDPAPEDSVDGSAASCLPSRLEGALGSGLYRLPSDAQLLSFASCIAA